MNGTSKYRRIGRVMTPVRRHLITASGFHDTLAIGDVMFAAAGNKAFPLTCVSSEAGAPMNLKSMAFREFYASGSAITLKHRWYFVKSEINATPGSPLYIPYGHTLGWVDIEDTEYLTIADDATATNGTSQVQKKDINLIMYPGDYTATIYAVPMALAAGTYASGCLAEAEFFIEQY